VQLQSKTSRTLAGNVTAPPDMFQLDGRAEPKRGRTDTVPTGSITPRRQEEEKVSENKPPAPHTKGRGKRGNTSGQEEATGSNKKTGGKNARYRRKGKIPYNARRTLG